MNTLKYWGTVQKARAGDRSLGVYGSRGKHVLKKNLSSQQESLKPVPPSNEQLIPGTNNPSLPSQDLLKRTASVQISPVESTLSRMKKSYSSSSLNQLFPIHQTVTPLLTTNLTIGMLSSRSFSNNQRFVQQAAGTTKETNPTSHSTPKQQGNTPRVVFSAVQSIGEVKKDLIKGVNGQIQEIQSGESMSIHKDLAEKFIKSSQFKIREDLATNIATLAYSDGKHTVEVSFGLTEDTSEWDEPEEEQQEQRDDEELGEEEEETRQPGHGRGKVVDEDRPGISVSDVRSGKYLPEPWPKKHGLSINLIFHEGEGVVKGRWHLVGFAGEDNRLYVEEMRAVMGEVGKTAEGADAIEEVQPTLFDELNNDLQDRIYDFLDELGVDDRVAHFAKAYVVEYKNRTDIGFLNTLKTLMTEKDKSEEKPTPKPAQQQQRKK